MPINTHLYLIIFFGLLLRLHDLVGASVLERDGITCALMGESFAKGAFKETLNGVFPPLYPLMIGFFHLFVPDAERAGRLVSLVFGILLIYLCFFFLKGLLDEKRALIGAFLVAIHHYLVKFSAQVLSESLVIFLFTVTVYFFFKGRLKGNGRAIGLSGFFLALTYLTRPEYVIFYVPLALILLKEKRFRHIIALVLSFLVLAFLYVLCMRVETGVWILTNKALLNPFVSLPVLFKNVPVVTVHFLEALFPPFVMLLFLSFKGMNKSCRNLGLSLVFFHIVSLAFICHSTKRYSVGFVGVVTPFAVQRMDVLWRWFGMFRPRKLVYFITWALIIGLPFHRVSRSP